MERKKEKSLQKSAFGMFSRLAKEEERRRGLTKGNTEGENETKGLTSNGDLAINVSKNQNQ